LRFAPSETTHAYLEPVRSHVLAHGALFAFYSCRHEIFRVNAKDPSLACSVTQSGDGKTEFGQVTARLGIEAIHALTPQAKGRVERTNHTLQDRLVRQMRLRTISSTEEANADLPGFMARCNDRSL
jgi:hypothetical protein